MDIYEMIEHVKENGYSYEWIADKADISVDEVRKIFEGEIKSPNYITFSKLRKLFEEEDYMIREPLAAYLPQKQPGEFTIEDYYAIPDERRVELIDGVVYDMGAPTVGHQFICSKLGFILDSYIQRNKGKCFVFISPCDVQLNCDNRTMVQPDVFVVCNKDKLNIKNLYGAPDFVIEILSPSTRKKDMTLKLAKYSEAGVREYWIVDPKKKRIMAYNLENEELPVIYTFNDEVPVAIFGGKCKVNFAEIYNDIQFLYEKE